MVRTSGGSPSAAGARGRLSERAPPGGTAAAETDRGGRGAGARPARFGSGGEVIGEQDESFMGPIIPVRWLTT